MGLRIGRLLLPQRLQKIVQFGIKPDPHALVEASCGFAGMAVILKACTSASGDPAARDKLIPAHHSVTIPLLLITNLTSFAYFYL